MTLQFSIVVVSSGGPSYHGGRNGCSHDSLGAPDARREKVKGRLRERLQRDKGGGGGAAGGGSGGGGNCGSGCASAPRRPRHSRVSSDASWGRRILFCVHMSRYFRVVLHTILLIVRLTHLYTPLYGFNAFLHTIR